MAKLLKSILLVLLFVLMSAPPVFAERVVKIRADNWLPFTGEPDSDRPGFLIDIAKKIFERKGMKVDYAVMPWSRVLKEVGEGVYDGAAGASPEDAPDFLYTKDPQGMWTVACMVRSNVTIKCNSLSSLDSLQVGAMLGYVYGATEKGADIDQYIAARKGKNVQQLSGDSPLETAITMLQRGRLDVVLETPEVFFETVDSMKIDRKEFSVARELRPRTPIYIGFSPNNPASKEYIKILEEGMKWLRESGELAKIAAKYRVDLWPPPR